MHWFDVLCGVVCGMCIVLVPAIRVIQIMRHEMKLREAEVMSATSALAKERAIPKKRPRGMPVWPPRGEA